MNIKFWGVRGSIPTPLSSEEVEFKIVNALALAGFREIDLKSEDSIREFVKGLDPLEKGTAGGNTPCLQIDDGKEVVVCDAGSGIRPLGKELLKREFGRGEGVVHILMNHLHWDHIQGFPFFLPAYVKGNRIVIHSVHDYGEASYRRQQNFENFPVLIDQMAATIEFRKIENRETFMIGDLFVTPFELEHPGGSYAFRFDQRGKSCVYATDSAFLCCPKEYRDLWKDADAFVFDAMFTLQEAIQKLDWGHSSAHIGVDLSVNENVKKFVIFHHDPNNDDRQLNKILFDTKNYLKRLYPQSAMDVVLAREGMEIAL